jgi:hypothetical protein
MISDEALMLDFQKGAREAFEELLRAIGNRSMASSAGAWRAVSGRRT